MRLRAIKNFTYADKVLSPGDEFEASAEDARLLRGWDKAVPCEPVMTTESAEPISQPQPQKRTYRRRDMRAER